MVVETLAARSGPIEQAEPAEHAWACPKCGAVERLDPVWDEE
jgi:hypothetical protein